MNLEKSVNTANNTSLYYGKTNLDDKGYTQWSISPRHRDEMIRE